MEGSHNILIGEEEEQKDTNGKINEFSIREGEEEGSLSKNKWHFGKIHVPQENGWEIGSICDNVYLLVVWRLVFARDKSQSSLVDSRDGL